MLKHFSTEVWIGERAHRVLAASGKVLSGPFPGGFFRELKNQQSKNANLARQMAAGEVFSDGAHSNVRFYDAQP